MQSTADWLNEMPANSSDKMTTLTLQRSSRTDSNLTSFRTAILAFIGLGALGDILVLVGFRLVGGRSKMYLHCLELFACVSGFLRFSLDLAGVLTSYDASYLADWVLCLVIHSNHSAALIGGFSYAGMVAVIIITIDRYWKIVYPIHHRRYYRRWMFRLSLFLPWLSGIAFEIVPIMLTSRITKGRCIPQVVRKSLVKNEVHPCFSQFGTVSGQISK